jgi:hypothetical protein
MPTVASGVVATNTLRAPLVAVASDQAKLWM